MKQFVVLWRMAAAALLASACSVARADTAIDRWHFASSEDGLVTASLPAVNKLTTGGGALSYSPTLTIACRAGNDPQWSEWLHLNDAVSASRTITMAVTIDQDEGFDERWSVAGRGKMLVKDGADAVRRLVPATQLLLSWRFGLLSGRGEADFELAGVAGAISRIASDCKTDPL